MTYPSSLPWPAGLALYPATYHLHFQPSSLLSLIKSKVALCSTHNHDHPQAPRPHRPPADPAISDNWAPPGDHLAALKIVHARGMVESYYMALLAVHFIDRYPSFVFRPEVCQQPWDSVVWPEEIHMSSLAGRWRSSCSILGGALPSPPASVPLACRSMTLRSVKICTCTHNNVDSGAGKMIGLPMGRRREKGKGGGEGLRQQQRAGKTTAWQPELTVISESSAVYD